MTVDPSRFYKLNVIDTCAIWNVLSSRTLYSTSLSAGCSFSCTGFVYYESLVKPRTKSSTEDTKLKRRLESEMKKGQFPTYHLDLEDLLEVEILERRKNLGMGEISSIVFAKKTRQAFLTDDQSARKLAAEVMDNGMVQTIPHLFGWLFFTGRLLDGDKDTIIKEHENLGRPLVKHFEKIYNTALKYKVLSRISSQVQN